MITWDERPGFAFGYVDGECRYLVCDIRGHDDPPEKHCVLAARLPMPRDEKACFYWAFGRAKEACEMDEQGGAFDRRTGVWYDLPDELTLPRLAQTA
jgi:hypothetical protein